MDFFGLEQMGNTGQVVTVKDAEWITVYKVPVNNENAKTYDFFLAVKVGEQLPAQCHLIMVPKTRTLPAPVPEATINVDTPE